MFGYVLPSEPRLSEEDKAQFRAAYCGLCRGTDRQPRLF